MASTAGVDTQAAAGAVQGAQVQGVCDTMPHAHPYPYTYTILFLPHCSRVVAEHGMRQHTAQRGLCHPQRCFEQRLPA
jgi:hypothetical protein